MLAPPGRRKRVRNELRGERETECPWLSWPRFGKPDTMRYIAMRHHLTLTTQPLETNLTINNRLVKQRLMPRSNSMRLMGMNPGSIDPAGT